MTDTPYRSYVICTSPRSGSTLLCKLLAATGISGNPDSHFHSPCMSDWMRYYNLSAANFSSEVDLLKAIVQAAREKGTADTGIFGLRLQQPSFEYFMSKLSILCAGSNADSQADMIQNVFGSTLFIHLNRNSKLDQAISLVKAEQTGLWHKAPDGTVLEQKAHQKRPVYDAPAIARNLAKLTQMQTHWMSWFAEQDLEPLQISYDELSAEPATALTRILIHLGVHPIDTQNIEIPVAKLADATNTRWANRFLSEQRIQKHFLF